MSGIHFLMSWGLEGRKNECLAAFETFEKAVTSFIFAGGISSAKNYRRKLGINLPNSIVLFGSLFRGFCHGLFSLDEILHYLGEKGGQIEK